MIKQNEFSWPIQVYYEDTDAGGVVYYANYLKFLERARTEWLRYLGFEQDQLIKQFGIVFAVKRVELDYLSPARFNNKLRVTVSVKKLKRASIEFYQQVFKGDNLCCTGVVKISCLNLEKFRPVAMPSEIYECFINAE